VLEDGSRRRVLDRREYLAAAASQSGLPQEVIQAKFCGRWADGTPLVLSPDAPDPTLPLNDFDYSNDVPARSCPIASHIRRSQRRNEDTQQHRLLRRAAPYGPPYVPKDGQERGLTGHFICSSLANNSPSPAAARHPLPASGARGDRYPFAPLAGRRWAKAG
jgi:deferrochelatase/peroxidase EfeB